MALATVYIITNSENDKVYIGSTTQPLHRRMNEHRSRAKQGRGYDLYEEMRKVGIDKFEIAPLFEIPNATQEEIHRAELDTIKSYPDKARLLNTALGISYLDIDFIIEEYKSGKAIKKIAKERGHCSKSVSAVLKEYGVEIKDWNEIEKIKIDDEELRRMYVDEMMTTPEIAKVYDTSHQTILKRLKKLGIQPRKAVNRKYLMPSSLETER